MSKFDDPDNPDKVAQAPSSTIELLQKPVPTSTPPDPYDPNQGRGRIPFASDKSADKAEIKTAMVESPKQPTWVELMENSKRAYNENNNQAKGRDLHNIQPAATSVTTGKTEPPKAEPKASDFVKRLQSTPPPPPTNKPTGPKR